MLKYPYTLPPLPYAPEALAPVIDAETMTLHHGKHHQTYINNLNDALKEHTQLQALSLHDLLAKIAEVPEAIRNTVRNNGGGHINHAMFWEIMGKPTENAEPTGEVFAAVNSAFGSFDEFKKQFNTAGTKQFGSGWVFVTVDDAGTLAIQPQPNQDTPIMQQKKVLFGNDVWEHAYYLTYRNRRADYLTAWWEVVDWSKVATRYTALKKGEKIV